MTDMTQTIVARATARKPRKPTAWARLCQNVATFAARWRDLSSFHSARLNAIEDRLAALDGGDNATAARRTALAVADDRRISAGGKPLGFRLAGGGDDLAIEWIGDETTGRAS